MELQLLINFILKDARPKIVIMCVFFLHLKKSFAIVFVSESCVFVYDAFLSS